MLLKVALKKNVKIKMVLRNNFATSSKSQLCQYNID